MFREYNPNPKCKRVGDCTVRAISKILNQSWEKTYLGLCIEGLLRSDMPSANSTWGSYLEKHGFKKMLTDSETVKEFALDNVGRCVVALSGHVVAVIDSDYFDTWDSGEEKPIYVWRCME